ncbi:ABC transporter ATP-binding protein [Dethiosulfatarculus sandiegensis]|uniref:Peptide ABC transporter ATP-binding protein n=1 Tax=Dethiosulfatarculus sandiegensis TaxID=1429043 RepID=A0A0D2J4K5_9BACT|nr:ABC transporter ATP-binding protein [Dethiosulfatarculus sandiegensis]KIX13024.1 peptide ABC transporter ATP-binding protein [Dethiosulfatarculus sandiegensis]
MGNSILEVKDLKVSFRTEDGVAFAVNGVDFTLNRGETLGIVGESGCGKSVSSLAILGLLPQPPAKVESGTIMYKGSDLLKKTDKEMQSIRGNEISMIFQEPMTSLNPLYTVGNQISEVIKLHQDLDAAQTRDKCIEMLTLAGIPSPEKRLKCYPHELSGGMRQRVMIAMALACNPEILIADEPTTALDVTIQVQILELMNELQRKFNTAIMMITHDLGVIAEMAHKVLVIYAGRVVEYADVNSIFDSPLHPYTEGLLASIPVLDDVKEELNVIKGMVPSPFNMPKGCSFHPRCPDAKDICRTEQPELYQAGDRQVRCYKYSSLW